MIDRMMAIETVNNLMKSGQTPLEEGYNRAIDDVLEILETQPAVEEVND